MSEREEDVHERKESKKEKERGYMAFHSDSGGGEEDEEDLKYEVADCYFHALTAKFSSL